MWHVIWQISLRIFVDYQMVLVLIDEVLSGNRLLGELASDTVALYGRGCLLWWVWSPGLRGGEQNWCKSWLYPWITKWCWCRPYFIGLFWRENKNVDEALSISEHSVCVATTDTNRCYCCFVVIIIIHRTFFRFSRHTYTQMSKQTKSNILKIVYWLYILG